MEEKNKVKDFLNKHSDIYKPSIIAVKIGISPTKISRWLSGKDDGKGRFAKLSEEELKKIIQVLKECAWK